MRPYPTAELVLCECQGEFFPRSQFTGDAQQGNKSLQYDLCCSSASHSVCEIMDRYPQVEAHLSWHFESR